MYGCAVDEDHPPMVVSLAVDASGTVHERWADWLVAHSPDLHNLLYIGHERRWPRSNVDETRVHRLLPLICSINPMGTPCVRLRLPSSATVSERNAEQAANVRRLLNRPVHRAAGALPSPGGGAAIVPRAVERGGPVGVPHGKRGRVGSAGVVAVVHTERVRADHGRDGTRMAHLFPGRRRHRQPGHPVRDGGAGPPPRRSGRGPPPTGQPRRGCRATHQRTGCWCVAPGIQAFLQEQRAADHLRRQAAEGTLFGVLGSATHHDLAQYIKHELRSVVVCTSLIGNGVWYVYQKERHRWAFDPEGADVLVRCLHILVDQVDRLRTDLDGNRTAAPAARPGRSGGGSSRVPFTRLANFPDEAGDPGEIQKAILIHLDTHGGQPAGCGRVPAGPGDGRRAEHAVRRALPGQAAGPPSGHGWTHETSWCRTGASQTSWTSRTNTWCPLRTASWTWIGTVRFTWTFKGDRESRECQSIHQGSICPVNAGSLYLTGPP
jgi:hypothetical protein